MRICGACGSTRCDDAWRSADCGHEPARIGRLPAFAPGLAADKAGFHPQDEHAYHVRRYTSADLRRKVEEAGFEIVRMTSFVALLLPLLFASRMRLRRRASAAPFDAIDALRTPAPINGALGAVMTLERAAIRSGLSFPAGGSLLLVARRRARPGEPA